MRVTAEFWVSAFLVRERARGAFPAIVKKGAAEAGAIYIVENLLNGKLNLYGPAPQALFESDADERQFEQILCLVDQSQVDESLIRQQKFDSDIWVIETECKTGPPDIGMVYSAQTNQKSPRQTPFTK